MIKVAKSIEWMPEFGLERELDWLKNMHDWLISKKNRYWGLALPIYECKACGNFEVIGSKEELKRRAVKGWKAFEGHTPHKPFIDEVVIECFQCGKEVKRVDDVGNPWLDAGIVPYSTITENNQGEPLYLKNKKEWKKWFPANFITESFPGQFKNWFYALIAESTVLENTNPFERVLGYGTLLGEDGRAMHKSWGNMVEFNEGADKIGVDVMRWMFSRQNPAENMLFGYKKADEVRRQFYLMLWNVYKFFVEYANLDKWSGHPQGDQNYIGHPKGVLDKWILNRFTWLVDFVEKSLREYNAQSAALEIEKFVSDLSTWYVRRSRDRVWVNSEDKNDKKSFYKTLYYVLSNLSIILSPFIPFLSEEIYVNLTCLPAGMAGKESVHLTVWPMVNKNLFDEKLEAQMKLARQIVEAGHAIRKAENKKVRIPLAKLEITIDENYSKIVDEIWEIVLKELNIKNIIINKKTKYPQKEVIVTKEELLIEGEIRELIRSIQSQRKKMGLRPTDKVRVTVPKRFTKQVDYIKRKIIAEKLFFGNELKIEL